MRTRSLSRIGAGTLTLTIAVACTDAWPPSGDLLEPGFSHTPGHRDGTFPTVTSLRDGATDNIRSDAELRSDAQYAGPTYTDGACGVMSNLGNLNDARMDPDAAYSGKKLERSCGRARVLIFEWDQPADGGLTKPTRVDGIFSNIDHVLTVTGADERRKGQFNVCSRLIFNPDDRDIPNNGSDLLLVSFDDKGDADPANDEWTVRTQPYPTDKGYCEGDGRLWHMPFQLTIRRK